MDALHKRSKIGVFILATALIAAIFGVQLKSKQESKLTEIALTHEQANALSPTVLVSADMAKAASVKESNVGLSSAKALESENQTLRPMREVGDTTKFSGYTIVKIDPRDSEENPEMALLQADWNEAAAQFLSRKMGLSPEQIERYTRASAEAFAEYDRKSMEVLNSAKKLYGPDIAIVIEGDLQTEYDRAWKAYDESVNGIMGGRVNEEFKDFVERFNSIAFDRVGLVPSFIR